MGKTAFDELVSGLGINPDDLDEISINEDSNVDNNLNDNVSIDKNIEQDDSKDNVSDEVNDSTSDESKDNISPNETEDNISDESKDNTSDETEDKDLNNEDIPSINQEDKKIDKVEPQEDKVIQIDDMQFTPDELKNIITNYKVIDEKLENFKDIEKYSTKIKEAINDENFFLALEASKGNIDAIKELTKRNKIDPMSLVEDEETKQDSFKVDKSKFENDLIDTIANNFIAVAKVNKVDDKLSKVFNEWDNSISDVMKNGNDTNTLINQLKDGTYDEIMKIANKKSLVDLNFKNKTTLEQYIDSANEYFASQQAKLKVNKNNINQESKNIRKENIKKIDKIKKASDNKNIVTKKVEEKQTSFADIKDDEEFMNAITEFLNIDR